MRKDKLATVGEAAQPEQVQVEGAVRPSICAARPAAIAGAQPLPYEQAVARKSPGTLSTGPTTGLLSGAMAIAPDHTSATSGPSKTGNALRNSPSEYSRNARVDPGHTTPDHRTVQDPFPSIAGATTSRAARRDRSPVCLCPSFP